MKTNLFLLIGTQKAGTTTLYDIFKEHSSINCANVKESRFFSSDDYLKGKGFYLNTYFDNDNFHLPLLDVDPELIYTDVAPERIANQFGQDVKFIIVLRDPANRAYSNYIMERFRKNEPLSFSDAIAEEPSRLQTSHGKYVFSYLNRGYYHKQIMKYLKFFPLDNFSIHLFEDDFILNRKKMMERICAFMDIPYVDQLLVNKKRNPGRTTRYKFIDKIVDGAYTTSVVDKLIPKKLRRRIGRMLHNINTTQKGISGLPDSTRIQINNEYFTEEIERLERLIGRDLSSWLK